MARVSTYGTRTWGVGPYGLYDQPGGGSSITYSVSGGITYAGSVTPLFTRAMAPAGGVSFAGTVSALLTRGYSVAGGVTVGGSATATAARAYSVADGMVFGGSADYSSRDAVVTWSPVGGITFGGTVAWITKVAGALKANVINPIIGPVRDTVNRSKFW